MPLYVGSVKMADTLSLSGAQKDSANTRTQNTKKISCSYRQLSRNSSPNCIIFDHSITVGDVLNEF